jgi:hypothetical protein
MSYSVGSSAFSSRGRKAIDDDVVRSDGSMWAITHRPSELSETGR